MCQDPEAGKSLAGLKDREKPSVVAMSGMREVRRRQGRTWVSLGLMGFVKYKEPLDNGKQGRGEN